MNHDTAEAYPLHWPAGRPRISQWNRKRAPFGRTSVKQYSNSGGTYKVKNQLAVADGCDRLVGEMEMLAATYLVISSNVILRKDGLPRSGQSQPDDPGVSVYFQLDEQPHCSSCDQWDRVADNLAAIAKHVEAMRGQVRWGVADIRTMFSGFKQLPPAPGSSGSSREPFTFESAARFMAEASGEKCHGRDLAACRKQRMCWINIMDSHKKETHVMFKGISIKDHPNAPPPLHVSEKDFDGDPHKYLKIGREKQQIIVENDNGEIVLVAGTNRQVEIVLDPEITKIPEYSVDPDKHIDWDCWFR